MERIELFCFVFVLPSVAVIAMAWRDERKRKRKELAAKMLARIKGEYRKEGGR